MGAFRLSPGPTLRPAVFRRGVAALLAMLYLVLFSVIAIGFFSSTTLSRQIVENDLDAAQAQLAAESGLEFMRMQLKEIKVPAFTSDDALLAAVHGQLDAELTGTPNLGHRKVVLSNKRVSLPNGNAVIDLGDGGFRAEIRVVAGCLSLDVTGVSSDGRLERTIRCGFDRIERNSILNYAVVSRGKIVTGSSSVVTATPDPRTANLLSTSSTELQPIVLGGAVVGGSAAITRADAEIVHQSGTVHGQSDKSEIEKHLLKGVPAPEFPTLNPGLFEKYVESVYSTTGSLLDNVLTRANTYTNCRVKTGTNPKFGAHDVIEGVLWIEPGNTVEFSGGCTIRGLIVVEADPRFTPEQTRILFRGSVHAYGVETLDPANFGDLVQKTGTFILAPCAIVDFGGNMTTTAVGSIFAAKVSIGGSAGGSVVGNVVSLDPRHTTTIASNQSSPLTFVGRSVVAPAGTSFSSYFTIRGSTYGEIGSRE